MNTPTTIPNPLFPAPGTAIGVSFGLYRHVGIVSDKYEDGVPMVISASKRRGLTAEESWEDFTGGRAVMNLSLRTFFATPEILERARASLGRPWRLFTWNCEHMVRHAYGLSHESPQVRKWVKRAGAVVATVLSFHAARRHRA